MIKKKKRRANKNRVIYRELKDGQGERERERENRENEQFYLNF